MTAASVRRDGSLTIPLSASLVLHLALVAAVVFIKTGPSHAPVPVMYQVHMVAAQAGERAEGVVNPPKAPAAVKQTPPPKAHEAAPKPSKRPPVTSAVKTTPVPPKAAAPPKAAEVSKAGGGETGGKGTDVANVDLKGIAFPFPAYLENIVRKVVVEFGTWNGPQTYHVDVSFIILRDGTVTGITLVNQDKSVANFEFRTKALGSVEAVGRRKGFGPLPDGFGDDALPVVFSFDPRIIK